MDLRTRPMWSVRAMRRLMTRAAPIACVEALAEPKPVPSQPTAAAAVAASAAAVASAQTPVIEGARVVAVSNAAWGPAPTGTPNAPVRVVAKVRAAVSSAPASSAPASAPAAVAPASGPVRLPTAPVKNGRAYDLDGAPMTAPATRRIAPWRKGQGVRPRAAFTPGEGVGYNGHHEGARHVARCAAVAAAKARGPPGRNR